jgi:hypothetical protein
MWVKMPEMFIKKSRFTIKQNLSFYLKVSHFNKRPEEKNRDRKE